MRVLKICTGTWANASHDKRELSVCRELEADVEVVAKGNITGQIEYVDGFKVARLSTRPLGDRFPSSINRFVSVFTWAHYVRKMNVNVITGHDISGLAIGYLSNLLKRHKAILVYDSHEFELERGDRNRGKFAKWLVSVSEKYLMKHCVFSTMVSNSIADAVQRIHGLSSRPVVVRNIPNYVELNNDIIDANRKSFLQTLGLPEDTFIVMFHGVISRICGVENMLRAVNKVPGAAAVIIGNIPDETYRSTLKDLCGELCIDNRVLFVPAVPLADLFDYVAAADVGIITIPPLSKSLIMCLPNKLFENIQGMTPVIVSDFPEMGSLVDQYGIGLKVVPENADELANAITRMMTDKALYNSFKKNLVKAKNELCWEKEKETLKEAYREILK